MESDSNKLINKMEKAQENMFCLKHFNEGKEKLKEHL